MRVNQPTLRPTNKMIAVGSSGFAGWALVAIASSFGVEMPPEVASGAIAFISWLIGYAVQDEAVEGDRRGSNY